MHVLVTGAGGFIGARMVATALAAGWRVTGTYRHRPPRAPVHPDLSLLRHDLLADDGLPERFDALVHCAAEIPAHCPDPATLHHANVEGTRRLLAHAERAGADRVVYLSSMAVYGPIDVPVVDERTPCAAADAYGRSKLEGEHLLADWIDRTGGRGVSLRLPGVVGAGARNNFLGDTLLRVLAGEPVSARNPEAPFNNVLHVADLARFAVALLGDLPTRHAALTIAAIEPMPVRQVLSLLFRCAGRADAIAWGEGGGRPFLIGFDEARALGFRPATVADSVERFVADALAGAAPA